MPEQVASAVLDAIEGRGDVEAAGLLAALGVLATEPLAARSRAGGQRLAEEGVVSPIAAGVGMLAVQDAAQIDCPDAELLVVLLRRPGAPEVQAALLGIERHDTGGVLVQCALTPPTSIAAVRELLSGGVHYGAAPVPIAAEELTARVLAAARRAVEPRTAGQDDRADQRGRRLSRNDLPGVSGDCHRAPAEREGARIRHQAQASPSAGGSGRRAASPPAGDADRRSGRRT
ncbi:MAG: hypothetical protein ABSG43_18055 [Solirubrobacteraceae bacterium]